MFDENSWLGKKEEIEFRKLEFRGKNAGKIYRYSNHIDGLIRTRAIIFAMVIFVFYPVLMYCLMTNHFPEILFFERLIFSLVFLISGLLFNKFRILSIIIAIIPMLFITATNLFSGAFDIYRIGYSLAILLFIISGLYHHFKAKSLEKELSHTLLENQLIENDVE